MWWLVSALLLVPQASAPNLYKEAGSALASGDLAAAQARLEELTVKDPANARAWMLLAQTYARRKNSAAALAAASQSEKLGSRDAEVLHGLVFLFTELQPDLNRAASIEGRYAELQPTDQTAWRRAAAMYLAAGQYDRAILMGTRGLAADDSQELHTVLGQAYQGKQDWEHAAEHLAAAVKLARYDETAHFLLIQMYLGHEDFTHASEAIADARKVFARSPQIELAAGVCAYGLRRFPEAVDQFLKTIALAPDVPQPYLFLSRILDQAGERLPEVVGRFRQFRELHPDDAQACLLYAKGLLAEIAPGEFPPEAEQAMHLLEHARSLDPNQAEVHYQLGCLLERKHDYAGAAAELERSVALDPRQPGAHFQLARVYERQGRKQDAIRERDEHQRLAESIDVPRNDVPRSDVPQSGVRQRDIPRNYVPQSDVPQSDVPLSDAPRNDAPRSDAPRNDAPRSDPPQSNVPRSDAPQNDAPPNDETRIRNLIDEVAQSGRVLEAGLLSDRLGEQRQIAPGRPPLLQFRYLEGVKRHGFGSLDLVIDDAGH
jgi:tetratricopeptide (TPR) repeat protein